MQDELDLLIEELEDMYELMNPIVLCPLHSEEARSAIRHFADLVSAQNPPLARILRERMDRTEQFSTEELITKENELRDLLDRYKLQGYDIPNNLPTKRNIH